LQDSWAGRARYSARARRRAQLGEQIGDGLSREIVLDSESTGLFAAVLILRPELAKPHLETLRDGGLCNETPQDQLAGRINPVRRQRGDHLTPHPLLERIEIRRRFRTPCAGNQYRDDSKRGWRPVTATRHEDFPSFALDASPTLAVLINAQIAAPLWLPKKLLAIVVDQAYNLK
jgi:hypothetical protein